MSEPGTSTETKVTKLVKKPAVGWFNLQMLVTVAVQALVTAATGNRTTRREVLAALDTETERAEEHLAASTGQSARLSSDPKGDAIWVDYVADLGDGFDATHSIAWLVGRDFLGLGEVGKPTPQPIPKDNMTEAPESDFDGCDHILPGGSTTIFGGDLVYPAASSQNYEDRTVGPYYAARPWQKVGDDFVGRALYSIPGNHDWYDGLASFVHRFCQRGRWMGAWQVQQKRSYFAVQLGHGYSIWGLDLATTDNFDAAQLEYFQKKAAELKEDENVILCVPKPAWTDYAVETEGKLSGQGSDAWRSINLIMKKVGANNSGYANPPRIAAVISGDHHHYVRHQQIKPVDGDPVSLITCGGGGAFMLGTDAVPEKLDLEESFIAEKQICFPSEAESKSMRKGVFLMFYRHKLFCLVLATIMLSVVWLMESASRALLGSAEVTSTMTITFDATVLGALRLGFSDFLSTVGKTLIFTPTHSLLVIGIAAGFIMFAQSSRSKESPSWSGIVAGGVHFIAQMAVALGLAFLVMALFGILDANFWLFVLLLPIVTLGLGWVFSGLVFSFYIWLSNILFKLHGQEVYSSQAIEDWKTFLRMRIGPDGLTIYPIGLRKISRDWQSSLQPGGSTSIAAADDKKLMQRALIRLGLQSISFEVQKGSTNLLRPSSPLEPHLIEKEIFIKKRGVAV